MNILIDQIMELSGPVRSSERHRHWLASLSGPVLEARLRTLREEARKPATAAHWYDRSGASKRLEAVLG